MAKRLLLNLHLVLPLTLWHHVSFTCPLIYLLPRVRRRTFLPCLGLQQGCGAPGWRHMKAGCPSSHARKPEDVASEPPAVEPSRSQQPPVIRTQKWNDNMNRIYKEEKKQAFMAMFYSLQLIYPVPSYDVLLKSILSPEMKWNRERNAWFNMHLWKNIKAWLGLAAAIFTLLNDTL